MMRVFMTMLCSLLTVCSVSAQISRQEGTDGQAAIYRLPLMERAFLCCRYFEGWHSEKHYPYVGWGHKLLPNEKYSARTMTKRDADELLRIQNAKIFTTVRNVATWSKEWEYGDPETGGLAPRTYSLGINLTF